MQFVVSNLCFMDKGHVGHQYVIIQEKNLKNPVKIYRLTDNNNKNYTAAVRRCYN
jgi:hypothetical protein